MCTSSGICALAEVGIKNPHRHRKTAANRNCLTKKTARRECVVGQIEEVMEVCGELLAKSCRNGKKNFLSCFCGKDPRGEILPGLSTSKCNVRD
jgi:hypothetical protein